MRKGFSWRSKSAQGVHQPCHDMSCHGRKVWPSVGVQGPELGKRQVHHLDAARRGTLKAVFPAATFPGAQCMPVALQNDATCVVYIHSDDYTKHKQMQPQSTRIASNWQCFGNTGHDKTTFQAQRRKDFTMVIHIAP